MNERRAKIAFWLILAGAALMLSVGAGSVPLLDPDESRFARTSVEMMRSGDLVVPTFEGRPRLVKPPLLHWIQTALFRAFGAWERVARLPAAVATLGSLLIVGWIARRRFGYEGALWAAAVLGTMPLVMAIGRLGTLDALLAVHVLAAVALDIAEPKETGAYRGLAIGGLLGLAFLAKGPVGVILPLLVMLAGRTASSREILPSPAAVLQGLAGWCLVALPWGLAFLHRLGGGTAFEIVRGEVLQRFFAGTGHEEPPWFFLAVLAVGVFPWIGPLVIGSVRMFAQRNDPASRTALYAGAGFWAGVFFFSLGQSKLATYVLPLVPLAAVLITWELGQELRAPRERSGGSAVLTASLGAAAVGLILALGTGIGRVPAGIAPAGAAIFGTGALVGLAGMLARKPRLVYGSSAASSALFLLMALVFVLPPVSQTRTAAYLVEAFPELRDPDRPLIMVDMKVPSLTFYLDRLPEEVYLVDLAGRLSAEGDRRPLLVFDEEDLPAAAPEVMQRLEEIGRQGKYIVFTTRASPVDERSR